MNHFSEIESKAGALLCAWRAKAMDAVLVWLAIIILSAIVLILFAQGLVLPGIARGMSLAAFLVLLPTIWRRDWSSLMAYLSRRRGAHQIRPIGGQ